MSASLRDFVQRAQERKRIRFGDLRRLKRDVLPARISTREEAELLIALDRSVDRADRDWREYLIATVRDFIIWGWPPPGRIDRAKAEWLAAVLRDSHSSTARTIGRAVSRDAPEIDDAALRQRARRRGAAAPKSEVGSHPAS